MLLTAEQGGPTNGAGIGSVQGMLKQGKTETLPSLPVAEALHNAGRIRGIGVTDNPAFVGEGKVERQLGRDIKTFDNTVGADPRVPLSSCDGAIDLHPRGVDLLFPIRLANLSSEESLLAGPVTLVGKLVRAVRKPGQEYVDDASLATFSGPVEKIDGSQGGDESRLGDELTSDSVVLAPGAVILQGRGLSLAGPLRQMTSQRDTTRPVHARHRGRNLFQAELALREMGLPSLLVASTTSNCSPR
jgi:hypothetical protein